MRTPFAILIAVNFTSAAFGQIRNIAGTGYTGAPYSAVETQVSPTGSFTALLSRDGLGRTRQEYITRQEDGSELHAIRIMDPTTGLVLQWRTGSNVFDHSVSVTQLPMQQRRTAPVPDIPDPKPGTKSCGGGCSMENFPAQVINGYRCQGFRAKRMVRDPANKSLSIQTTENWTSTELGIILRHSEIDVLGGRVSSEINNISRGEPDPVLFQTPPGYTVNIDSSLGRSGR